MDPQQIDNPMARPLSRAEEDRFYGDEQAAMRARAFATDRTLEVLRENGDGAFANLKVGEYGRERDLLGQVLKLAAGRRDADVVASAVNELLAEIVKNRDPDYWDAIDDRARRINAAWHLSNSIASMACRLNIRSKA